MYYLRIALQLLLGLTFIASAVLKLFPIEPFEINFVDVGLANWQTAPFFSRAIIGLELFLGAMLLSFLHTGKKIHVSTIALLIVFSLYLIVQMTVDGEGDCGCFGTYLQMTPLESLLKNGVMIAMSALLVTQPLGWKWKRANVFGIAVFCLSFATPHIVNPIDLIAAANLQEEVTDFPLDVDALESNALNKVPVNLRQGTFVIGFFSLKCSHCRTLAMKMQVLKKENEAYNMLMVLNGKADQLPEFLSATGSTQIPHFRLPAEPFAKLTGGRVPTVFLAQNGRIIRILRLPEINHETLSKFFPLS